jgi:hypothetical protein
MDSRLRFFIAGLVASLAAYLFTTVATTGELDLLVTAGFVVMTAVVTVAFERFMLWAERFDETPAAEPTR